jgi:hypothetical protein
MYHHPLHSQAMKDIVATMPQHVKDLHADFLAILDDTGTPDYDERLKKARHAFANALHVEFLKEEEKKMDAEQSDQKQS